MSSTPPIDVSVLLARAAQEAPDSVAVITPGGDRRTTSWAELETAVDQVASGLAGVGVVGGHRVVLCLGNRLEFLYAYLGVLRAHAVAVPVPVGCPAPDLERMLTDSGARMVFCDESTVAVVREALSRLPESGCRVVVVGEASPQGPAEQTLDDLRATGGRALPERWDPESLAVLLYTSGASGEPRGVMLSHRALLANLDQVAAVDPPMIHADDVVLGVLPLTHIYGLNAVLGGVLRNRARLVLPDRFHPVETLETIVAEQVTVLPLAPAVFAHWLPVPDLADKLASVRLITSGSATLSREQIERFTELTGLPVHQGYGLTEAAPVLTSTLCSPPDGPSGQSPIPVAVGSVGAALPGVEVRLRDSRGREAHGEDPGEIQVRGANLFDGYWPDASDGPDAEGWWPTGDVGYYDPAGNLFLIDRVTDVVVVSGFSVYPTEVEAVISRIPGVASCAVVGVPDPETGEAVVAWVTAESDGADADGDAEGAEGDEGDELRTAVAQACRAHLARFKQPREVHLVDRLPVTVTGRVRKGRLRAEARRRAYPLIDGPGAPQ